MIRSRKLSDVEIRKLRHWMEENKSRITGGLIPGQSVKYRGVDYAFIDSDDYPGSGLVTIVSRNGNLVEGVDRKDLIVR